MEKYLEPDSKLPRVVGSHTLRFPYGGELLIHHLDDGRYVIAQESLELFFDSVGGK